MVSLLSKTESDDTDQQNYILKNTTKTIEWRRTIYIGRISSIIPATVVFGASPVVSIGGLRKAAAASRVWFSRCTTVAHWLVLLESPRRYVFLLLQKPSAYLWFHHHFQFYVAFGYRTVTWWWRRRRRRIIGGSSYGSFVDEKCEGKEEQDLEKKIVNLHLFLVNLQLQQIYIHNMYIYVEALRVSFWR